MELDELHKLSLKQLKQLNKTNLFCKEIQRSLFDHACQNNLLKRAQWIYSLGNIYPYCYFPLVASRYARHLEIIQWIRSKWIHFIDTKISDNVIWRAACNNGNMDIVKWICSISSELDIHCDDDDAFKRACFHNNLEIVQLLLELGAPKQFNNIDGEWIVAILDHNPKNIKYIPDEYLPEHIRNRRFMRTKSAKNSSIIKYETLPRIQHEQCQYQCQHQDQH